MRHNSVTGELFAIEYLSLNPDGGSIADEINSLVKRTATKNNVESYHFDSYIVNNTSEYSELSLKKIIQNLKDLKVDYDKSSIDKSSKVNEALEILLSL